MDNAVLFALARVAFGALGLVLIGRLLRNARAHVSRRAFVFYGVALATYAVLLVLRARITAGLPDPPELRQLIEMVFATALAGALLEHVGADQKRHDALQRAMAESRQARLLAEKRAREVEALSGVTSQIAASLDLRQVLQTVVDNALALSEADAATVFVRDRETGRLSHHGIGALSSHLGGVDLPLPRPNGLTESVARSGQGVFVADAKDNSFFADQAAGGPQAMASLPLRLEGDVLGVMNVSYLRPHRFETDEERMLTALADSSALAVHNAMLHEQIASMAVTDELTGLANRRRFLEALQTEIERAHRYKRPLALLMIDMDALKQANDRYGHAAGDALLRGVAQALSGGVRKTDVAARLGGDEFAVLLPETGSQGAAVIAERCRAGAARLNLTLEPLDQAGTRPGPVPAQLRGTLSIGVAACQSDSLPELQSLLRLADEALYRAKASGGDRVVTG